MRNIIIGVYLLVFLNGCALQSALIRPDKPIDKNFGVILASVTKKGGSDVWFYYQKEGETSEHRMDAMGLGLPMADAPDDYPQDENRKGRLLAFKVEPGKYYLTRWEIYAYFGTGYKYIGPKDPKPLPFVVRPGEITYLGNLHVDTLFGKNIFGLPIPAGGISSIESREEIDMPLLKEKYPNIRDWPVVLDIPDRSQWKI